MARDTLIHNPLGWVQLRLSGGPRGVFFIAVMYTTVVVLFLTLFYRLTIDEVSTSQFASTAMTVLIFIELIILLLGGTTIISKAVQRDFTSDMITSHRMSAMSGKSVVFGYLTGSAAPVIAVTIANWIICTFLSKVASPGVPAAIYAPTFLFFVFGCTAWMVFNLAVMLALCTRGSQLTAGLVVGLIMLTNTKATTFIPGLAILLASATYSSLATNASATTIDPWLIVSVMAQIVLGLIFFVAASRKMHRDDYFAFSPALAIALLGFSTLLAAMGLQYWELPATVFKIPGSDNERFQTVATITVLCLISILLVANAAKNRVDWARRRSKDPAFTGRAPWTFVAAAAFCTALVTAAFWAIARVKFAAFFDELQETVAIGYSPIQRVGSIVASFLIALLMAGCVFRLQRRISGPSAGGGLSIAMFLPLVGYLAIYWIVPISAALAIEATYLPIEEAGLSILFTCSPIGSWIVACSNINSPLWWGICVQAGVLAILLAVTEKVRR